MSAFAGSLILMSLLQPSCFPALYKLCCILPVLATSREPRSHYFDDMGLRVLNNIFLLKVLILFVCFAGLVDESNLLEWEIMIIGPPDTL